jgi:predicted small lipoprotein YifL
MKRRGDWLAVMVGVVIVSLIGCGQEGPKTNAPSAPAAQSPPAPSKSATDSAGQAVVDSIKQPLDKSRAVEGTLEKAAEKTADQVKDVAP